MPVNTKSRLQKPLSARARNSSRRLQCLVGILLLIGLVAGWMWFAPRHHERQVQSASLVELNALTARDSRDERALYYLALRQEQSAQQKAAMESYWRALQLDQDDEAAWLGWARTTQAVLGISQASQVLDMCLKRNPNSSAALAMLAHVYQLQGDHQAAYNTAKKGATLAPNDASLWQLMGSEAALLDNHADAEAAFRKAVALAPSDWRNHAGLGDALSHLARRPEAISSLREAVRLAPLVSVTHILLGTELLNVATADQGIEAARNEMLLAWQQEQSLPKSLRFQASLMLGESYKRQHRWQEARGWYEKAATLMPVDPTVPYSLITVYRELGDTNAMQKAVARHRELIAYDHELRTTLDRIATVPNDLQARLKLARLYSSHDLVDEAVRTYTSLLEKFPNASVAQQELQRLTNRQHTSAH